METEPCPSFGREKARGRWKRVSSQAVKTIERRDPQEALKNSTDALQRSTQETTTCVGRGGGDGKTKALLIRVHHTKQHHTSRPLAAAAPAAAAAAAVAAATTFLGEASSEGAGGLGGHSTTVNNRTLDVRSREHAYIGE